MKIKNILIPSFSLIISIILISCVNYEQSTVLNYDGSGNMKIHYWTSMKNFSMGTTIGKFEFEDKKVKYSFTSFNTEITNQKIEDVLSDSTKHVWLDIKFNDITRLSDAQGFSNTAVRWSENSYGKELNYVIEKDTSAAINLGSSDVTITYTFEFPGNIITTNAGKLEGRILTWNYRLKDLIRDLELNALITSQQ